MTFDHAEWVNSEITSAKRRIPISAERRAAAKKLGWHAAPDELTAFQRKAFTILGIVASGIYNAPISWETVYWGTHGLSVLWLGDWATWDFNQLTRFVFLCHEARIRGGIAPADKHHLTIHLSPRTSEGQMSQRHPNLDESVARFREDFPADHPIVFKPVVAELEHAS